MTARLPRALALGTLLCGIAVGRPAWGQEGAGRPDAEEASAVADSLYFSAHDAEASLRVLERSLEAGDDDSYGALWRAARAAGALGIVADHRPPERDAWLERALEYASRAVAADSAGLDGRYWRVFARGRLSLHTSAGRAADLARDVRREAEWILSVDSTHAGAHNALGRLNLEVISLPLWKRTIARAVAGDALGGTGWERAERHLRRALELEPANVLYLRDLAAAHLHRGNERAARILLERLVAREGLTPWDRVFQDEGRAMLERLLT